jgi:hypothetical protein
MREVAVDPGTHLERIKRAGPERRHHALVGEY